MVYQVDNNIWCKDIYHLMNTESVWCRDYIHPTLMNDERHRIKLTLTCREKTREIYLPFLQSMLQ